MDMRNWLKIPPLQEYNRKKYQNVYDKTITKMLSKTKTTQKYFRKIIK